MRQRISVIAALLSAAGVQAQAQTPPRPPELPVEESDVAALPVLGPRVVMVNTNWGSTGARLFDGDTGKMLGLIHEAQLSNVALDPAGRYFYVAESIWTKGNRGTRQDMLTVRDARTLKVVREIALPGRLLVGTRKHDLGISADGRYAYVYDFDPASSIIVVDLVRSRVLGRTEVPGCGLSAAIGAAASLSLCADGALAVTTLDARGRGSVSRSESFFSAENDPIFDNFAVDTASGAAMMLSYTGLVYPVDASGEPKAPTPWSVQEAAGLPRASTAPLAVNWLPGGRQPMAWHKPSGRLFVLMHMGEYWSQKEPGTELWVIDSATRRVLTRKKLKHKASFVEVSQDAQPLLFLNEEETLWVLDAATLEQKHEIANAGGGTLTTFGPVR
ncbi:amine dehydrogenase large subunit [Sphingomonas spermidinifaciens]|nr:amine dehydrogenase large subunit [Sphingomonas spermidinifaciens]